MSIENIKHLAISLALIVVAYSAYLYADTYASSVQPGNYRTFSVTGEGKAETKSDIGKFSFSVVTEGKMDIESSQNENAEKMNKAINYLKDNDVDEADIKTENYSVNPRYQYSNCGVMTRDQVEPCPPPEIVGYTISQNVFVKIRNIKDSGKLLSGVVKAGANQVSGLSFTVDNLSEIQSEAKEEAIADARAKAEVMAKAGGFEVGQLISIYDDGGYTPYGRGGMMESAVSMKAMDAAPPVIEAGSEENVVRVTLTYEIE